MAGGQQGWGERKMRLKRQRPGHRESPQSMLGEFNFILREPMKNFQQRKALFKSVCSIQNGLDRVNDDIGHKETNEKSTIGIHV